MRRGIGRLRAGGSGFSPASIFTAGTKGLWLDPSDITTGFQDSAGTTPQTASAQPTGKRLDKSGNANHVLQAGATARPEYDVISGISSDFFDGSNDGYSTATFAAGVLGADMDCFIAIKRAAAVQQVLFSQTPADGSRFFATMISGSAALAASGAGTSWSFYVNGSIVGGVNTTTCGQLYTATTIGSYVVLEARNLNLALWTQFTVGLYSAFMLNADVGGVILCPAQSSTNRDNLRRWLGAKVGLSL